MDCGLPGSSAHGILLARILEWVAISSSSRGSFRPGDQTHTCISCIGRRILHTEPPVRWKSNSNPHEQKRLRRWNSGVAPGGPGKPQVQATGTDLPWVPAAFIWILLCLLPIQNCSLHGDGVGGRWPMSDGQKENSSPRGICINGPGEAGPGGGSHIPEGEEGVCEMKGCGQIPDAAWNSAAAAVLQSQGCWPGAYTQENFRKRDFWKQTELDVLQCSSSSKVLVVRVH